MTKLSGTKQRIEAGSLGCVATFPQRKLNDKDNCPKGLLCRELKIFDVCASVRPPPPPPPTVRPSVTLIGSAPDLVTRNWVLPLERRSSTPKTGRFRDDLRTSNRSAHHLLSSDNNHVIHCVMA